MRLLLAGMVLVLPLSACGSGDDSGDVTLTVFAAASLTSTFTELGEEFEASHEGVRVTFSFAGSSDLVGQIRQGAPADVFASADSANMAKATAADLTRGDPVEFASNTLQIAVPPDNPGGVDSLEDLADPDLSVVLCAPEVPCGAAATGVQKAAGITISPVSEEQSVSGVLGKVTSGEADAGLVYVTDVLAAGDDVLGIPFPESEAVVNTYPIAALARSEHPDLAAEFVALVSGATGQSALRDAGFGQP